jgi:oligo-alginate lyase
MPIIKSLLLVGLVSVSAQTAAAQTTRAPRVFAIRGEELVRTRQAARANATQFTAAMQALRAAADKAAKAAPVAVTDKKTLLPPSNDKHDYFSLSPYWWPDSTKPNGLPYIRRDGVTNPESKRDLDQPRVAALGDRTFTLALAYYLTGEDRYAQAAARQIKTWFLDPATRMNPHLRFSQLVRGNPNERGSGIIDTRWFIEVVDAVGMLQGSKHWSAADEQQLRAWFADYLKWLRTSPNGAHERAAKNNHGSWYAAQTASYALFTGDTAAAREIIDGIKPRIASQIKPDGSQPEELARTRSLHYEMFNVEALSRLAEMGRHVGVDLWTYKAPEGGSLTVALERLAAYAARPQDWPGQQISEVEPDLFARVLRRGAFATRNAAVARAISQLTSEVARTDKSALLYPIAGEAKASLPNGEHPRIFITKAEAADIRGALGKYPLLDRSVASARAVVDRAIAGKIDVPPPGEAGGYAHERHKQNYREMQSAGLLYQITGDEKYARFVRDVLEKYAILYPTLGAHPLSKNQAPGKLFHQALNEANWLVAVAIAYDCVYEFLQPAERARFETNVLRPMADWLSVAHAKEFDRIHNHGTWAAASVGMLGLVINDDAYVGRALKGTRGDGKGGFLRQLDLLFSPDGYYMEGPYYIRYALMPFFYFAEALERVRPDVGIYAYRNRILEKGLYSAVQTAFPNGVFPPINDASRTMAITAPEVVLAVDLTYDRYGANSNLLGAAAIQDEVVLNRAGLKVAKAMAAATSPPQMSWPSVEFTDGFDGKRGGLGILRTGTGQNQTMLLMKYGVHGEGHGHFDKLHYILFDGGRAVIPDYGFSRWINIEPKFGGRYLPENDSYAMQTIAHNTVVVDQTTQNRADFDEAEAMWAERHWFDARRPNLQGMSAFARKYYPGVDMQRTMLLVRDERLRWPVVIDLYRLTSQQQHSYDLPTHFRGQLINTTAKYAADTTARAPLGSNYGYQHIWREAQGSVQGPLRLTWLEGNRYYTQISATAAGDEVIFGRTGAHDPNFNLIAEPLMILRRRAGDNLFASVIEAHGYFNESQERSEQARSTITDVRVIGHNNDASVIEVAGGGGVRWIVMVWNATASDTAAHAVTFGGNTYRWTGNFAVEGLQNAN